MFEAKVLPNGDPLPDLAASVPPADRVAPANQMAPTDPAPDDATRGARNAHPDPHDHPDPHERAAAPGPVSVPATPDSVPVSLPAPSGDDRGWNHEPTRDEGDEESGWEEDPEWEERERAWFDPTLVDPLLADLGGEALLDDLQATHRAIAAAQAREALLITELAHRRAKTAVTDLTGRQARGMEALTIGARAVGEEVAQEFTLSPSTAQSFTDTCVGLCLDTPDTLDALMRGDLDWAKAREILQLVQKLVISQADTNPDLPEDERIDPERLGKDLEQRLLEKAPQETRAEVKSRGRRQMIAANPNAAQSRHRRARTRRMVSFFPDDDSMAHLNAYLPADAGMRAKHALTRLAHHHRAAHPHDHRSLDHWRIDALVETLTHAADTLHPNPSANTNTGTGTQADSPAQTDGSTPQANGTARTDEAAHTDATTHTKGAPDSSRAHTNPHPAPDNGTITDQDPGRDTEPTQTHHRVQNADLDQHAEADPTERYSRDDTLGQDRVPSPDDGYLPDTDLDDPDPPHPRPSPSRPRPGRRPHRRTLDQRLGTHPPNPRQ